MLIYSDIEKALGVTPIETVSVHPDRPLYEACRKMLESRARRIPLVDIDDETHRTMVVSVITQYRILKFITVNIKETQKLRKPLRDLNVGTFKGLATALMDTPVMDVIHMLVQKNISSVPILDKNSMIQWLFCGFLSLICCRNSHQRFRSSRCDHTYQRRQLR
jgi:5'-AMP-activated protein kinase regulatory gamma subunit